MEISIGHRVKVFLENVGENGAWFEGEVRKIEPYSKHRSFYWVELNQDAQKMLKINMISVFNPKNIQKLT